MLSPRLLALAGSTRPGSFNRRVLEVAVEGARAAGAEVTVADLRDFRLPLYDAELEAAEGLPEAARRLKALMKDRDGFLIASPEYNSSITPLLKNTIDWASRPEAGEGPLAAFAGKSAVLMSASPGALGGLRGLVTVRSILGNIGVVVLPDQIAVPRAMEAFDDEGRLRDPGQEKALRGLGEKLATFACRLRNSPQP